MRVLRLEQPEQTLEILVRVLAWNLRQAKLTRTDWSTFLNRDLGTTNIDLTRAETSRKFENSEQFIDALRLEPPAASRSRARRLPVSANRSAQPASKSQNSKSSSKSQSAKPPLENTPRTPGWKDPRPKRRSASR